MSEIDVTLYFKEKAKEIEQALDTYLSQMEMYPEVIYESMRYSLFAGGKRLRPILAIAVAETLGVSAMSAMPFACALEMIHTYSLIHDDLPCMDDDDYRRGKLTNHKVFGDGIAVLAGDALLTYAFELMAQSVPAGLEGIGLQMIRELGQAAGVHGMIGGQVADIINEGKTANERSLAFIHAHKTGALLTASVRMGAILAKADAHTLAALTIYAKNIGLAFQIVDDILDVVGEEEKLGKTVGADANLEKMTYPSLYGIEQSRQMVYQLTTDAIGQLQQIDCDTSLLQAIAVYLVARDH
ncbi:polyprenyl synthetase family protein [Fodinisporobacter ferrooxydans]|uniref:Polyprenyl synthetase family protein n=1 Tax=Fodinisporobacter ferrooxydans TaxID=2901836 RepID=A0ABY4CHV8_9BACL|nr:polyprenyl synthetase family protein [Alicyclobacillaceae bacterium MYW30-H2]